MSVSFTLNLFSRGAGAMQTAATLIEFEAAAIAADATIRVATETINVPAIGCAGNACTGARIGPDGDDIQVTRISGTNRVRLTLTYFGSFAGGSLCGAPTIGVAGRSFAVELTGFTFDGGTIGYRIASFMAPSDASCDIPYVRVPSNRPTLDTAVGGTLDKLGRLPLSIVLVLDKSGSMGWTIPGQAAIRWDRLKQAVQLFANTWDLVSAPAPAVSTEGHAEDRLGLVFFDSTASDSNLDGIHFFKARGADATPWGTGVATALAAKGPGGSTALGAGIERGRLRLDDVDAVVGDTALVLFTDGEQNTPPCILHQGETMVGGCRVSPPGAGADALLTLNGSAVYPPAPDPPVLAQHVGPRGPIFTIGLGEGGMAASALLLDEIAQETAGTAWFPINGPALDTSFVDSLVNLLKGGTVSTLGRFAETLPATATSGTPVPVAIDPSLTRLVLVLGWEGNANLVELEIRRPDATVVQPTLVEAGPGSLVVALDLPPGGPSGTWQVRLINRDLGLDLMAATANVLTFTYHLTAYGVESRLSFRVTQSPRLGTGSPLTIVAEVGWDDAGLTGLPAGAIRAAIERPGENLGNALHDAATPAIDLRPDQTALMAKIAALADSAKLLDRVAPRALPDSIPLVDQGHGRYQGTFDGVRVGGQYRVRVDFDWSDPRTGDIFRTQYAERQAAVVPSVADTLVVLQRDPETGALSLLVTPRDRFGNYVGPGFGGFFTITVDGATVALPPVRDPGLTGVYEIALPEIPAGADPRIGILYRGEPLRDAPLSRIEQPGAGSSGWCGLGWWHLLLLLVLLLILWRLHLS